MNAPLPAIQVHDLAHCFGRRQALRGLDLDIDRGEIFAVLGPNGGGKTTLFRVLSTLLPVQRGRVTVGKPSLEDVFIDRTGRRFRSDDDWQRSPGGSSAG